MLFELNVSYVGVVPPADLRQLDPILSAEGSIGIDVRMIEDNAVITSIKSNFPGHQAGLRPGNIIKGIDGVKIEQISDIKHVNDIEYQNIEKETLKNLIILGPPYNERNRRNKAIKRATIIGERTPGVVLTADFAKLPNGATFLYPNAQTITADGTVLEGHGVVPDIEVAFDQNELLQGKDTQLEAAINFILKK